MKIGFNPGSIVDASGAPLQGRVLVFVHDSLEKKSIYTLQGSEYVASENPVLLDTTGRIPTTLFFDVGVVDVLVQKYVGEPGHLADESLDEDFEDFDRFEAGFDFDPTQAGSTEVDTVADLKDIENPSGIVRVNCYATPGDTFPRYYLWNPNCSATEDGGCVIADDHDASGKWCYLCEGDCIKSSVYGIKPGTDESNFYSFTHSPFGVTGDYVITYPKTLYVEAGTYTSMNYYSVSDKTVIFNNGAQFTQALFSCNEVEVDGKVDHYIADFISINNEARMSWFRTASRLWNVRTAHLLLDKDNLADHAITGSPTITGTTIEGNEIEVDYTYENNSRITIVFCTVVGRLIFNSDDRLHIQHSNFDIEWFWNISALNIGRTDDYKIRVWDLNIEDCRRQPGLYVEWAKSAGVSVIDLKGYTVNNIGRCPFSYIGNGIISGSIACENDLTLDNVKGNPSVYAYTSGVDLTVKNSTVSLYVGGPQFNSVTSVNSDVGVDNRVFIDTTSCAVNVKGGSFTGTLKCPGWNSNSGTSSRGKVVSFMDCSVTIGMQSWFDNLFMSDCILQGCANIIPNKNSSDVLTFVCSFRNNVVAGESGYGLAFTDSSVGNAYVYEVDVELLEIIDNVFRGASDITMRYFSNNGNNTMFLNGDVSSVYKGNIGSNIPKEPYSASYDANAYFSIFATTYALSSVVERVWNTSGYTYCDYTNNCLYIKSDGSVIDGKLKMLHSSERDGTNDMFSVQKALLLTDLVLMGGSSVVKVFGK